MTDPFYLDTELFDRTAFKVVSLQGAESLSTPFVFEVVGEADFPAVSLDAAGARARLQIQRHDGGYRSLVGRIRWFRIEGPSGKKRRVRAELVPALWITGERRRKRIFQNKRVPALVHELLDEHGVSHEFRLTRAESTYALREYCVQYAESDVEFITRLLSEEGIFYFFEHTDSAVKMVFGDDEHAYRKLDGDSVLRFSDTTKSDKDEHVKELALQRSVAPRQVVLRDYDFLRPKLDQTVHAEIPATASAPSALEVYEYPGGYKEPNVGKEIAATRLAALRREALRGVGVAVTRRLEPGVVFELKEHPFAELNRKWVVTRLRHSGQLAGELHHEVEFECVPDDVPFLPARVQRPSVTGVETAVVTGEVGEEITLDKDGRVHVKFHWDREGPEDAKSSCFIRVAQPWAGTGFGVWFAPRVGMEVVVSFVGGDPDQPMVTGCVYNATHPLPVNLPEQKTRSTIRTMTSPGGGGFNELRFEDLAGKEQVYLHAQRNLDEVVNASHTTQVGADRLSNVGGNDSHKVGASRTVAVVAADTLSAENRTVKINTTYKVYAGWIGLQVHNDLGGNSDFKMASDLITVQAEGIALNATKQSLEMHATTSLTGTGADILLLAGKFTAGTGSITKEGEVIKKSVIVFGDDQNRVISLNDLVVNGSKMIELSAASIQITSRDGNLALNGKTIDISAETITIKAKSINFMKQ